MNSGTLAPKRLVLDTNVLASALEFRGPPLQILDLGRTRLVELFASAFIMGELARALASKRFRWATGEIAESLEEIETFITIVAPSVQVDAVQTKDSDNRILECGLEAKADVIVTGNMRHLRPLGRFQGIDILTPREFLDRYFPYA
ncbi:MAG: putative toxin-antitoxin system toxin component, PIN family [Elusimicrobia bacterium]|nr:putative toxin-antitoxin system toxin component, PIN family [Elusimicrobiota bacterium]